MKFFHKLLLVSIILGLLPMAYLGQRSMSLIEARLTEEIHALHEAKVRNVVRAIDDYLIAKEREMTGFIYNQNITTLDRDTIQSLCDLMLSQNPEVEIITILDESMQEKVGRTRDMVTGYNDNVSPKALLDYLSLLSEEFLEAAQKGKSLSTITYQDATPYVTLAMPYPSNQKKLFGVVAAQISLQPLLSHLEADEEANVLLDSSKGIILKPEELDVRLPLSWKDLTDQEGSAFSLRSQKSSEVDIIAIQLPVPGTPWSLYHYVGRDYALSSLHFLRSSIQFLWFLIFIAVICVATVLSKRLVGPLNILTEAAREYGEGNLGYEFNIKGRDEIAVLASHFKEMALKIVTYMETEKESVRMEEELKVAQAVQRSLVTDSFPDLPQYDVAGFYQPASEAGGDWYGYVDIPEEKAMLFILGDVTGHGVGAALVTAASNTFFKTLELWFASPDISTEPHEILYHINRVIHRSTKGKMAMTMFVVKLYLETGKMEYANAGHNSPYVFHKPVPGEVVKKKPKILQPLVLKGTPLGYAAESEYKKKESQMQPGDYLMIFSDGIIECCNPSEEEFGKKRFKADLESYEKENSEEFIERIKDSAYTYYEGNPQNDDITLLMIRHKGAV